MNRKARKLKREPGGARSGAIGSIVLAVMLWITTAIIWPGLAYYRADMPWFIFYGPIIGWIVIGIFLLAIGIAWLDFTGKVAEILQDIVPDEDDE